MHSRNARGFTLVETVVYLAVVGTMIVAVVSFAIDLLDVRTKTHTVSEVGHNAWLMQERMQEAARHAEGINVGNSTFGSDPGLLELDMVDVGRDPLIFSLDQDDGTFQVNEAGGGAVPVTSDGVAVTNLVFRNLTSSEDTGIIQVEFSITAANDAGSPLYQYEQTFQTTLRIPID